MAWTTYPSPLGPLILIGGTSGLRHVYFPGPAPSLTPSDRNQSTLAETVGQLDEYFAGERQAFELQLDLAGSSFRHRVWRALQQVPYGHTITYGDLARELGITISGSLVTGRSVVSGAQKVAWAIAATPTPIVVPCHRVIAADGSLTGDQPPYSHGVRWQFEVDSAAEIDGIIEVCRIRQLEHDVIVEEGGKRFRRRCATVRSSAGVVVWFEGPNEA